MNAWTSTVCSYAVITALLWVYAARLLLTLRRLRREAGSRTVSGSGRE